MEQVFGSQKSVRIAPVFLDKDKKLEASRVYYTKTLGDLGEFSER